MARLSAIHRQGQVWVWIAGSHVSHARRNDGGLPAAARDALDLGFDDALDHARQIVVEPVLQHRPQHLAHQVFEGAGVVHQHGLSQRIEGRIDRRRGRGRYQPLGCAGLIRARLIQAWLIQVG